MTIKNKIPLILSMFVAFVFLQSLFFKFAGWFTESPADITIYIFQTIGIWIKDDLGLITLGDWFSQRGGIVIGLIELLASLLILITTTRIYGAIIGLAVMTGAIFFHLFTPLGLFPFTDLSCLKDGCPREYPLFFMAIGVWLSCAYLILKNK